LTFLNEKILNKETNEKNGLMVSMIVMGGRDIRMQKSIDKKFL
jgi:hypothetical protein